MQQSKTTSQTVDWEIHGAHVLNVFTRTFDQTTLWIKDGVILSNRMDTEYTATNILDATDKYIVPGFIDAHMHIESSLLTPSQLGPLLLSHGITSVVADPHELANVAGRAGIEYLLDDARQTDLDIFFMLPSAVPCAPFEHAGARLTAGDLAPLYANQQVHGLAEVMDFPALRHHDADLHQKIVDAHAHHLPVDGHLSGLHGAQLLPYQEMHIRSDHEATTPDELIERVKAGFYVYLREGTVERDLVNLLSAITPAILDRLAFCTDDKTVTDLLTEGGIDANIRLAIAHGLKPEVAYTMASLNAANGESLPHRGALIPGQVADLVLLDDLEDVHINRVMKRGKWCNQLTPSASCKPYHLTHIHQHVAIHDFDLPLNQPQANVIGVQPNHIATNHLITSVTTHNGLFSWNPLLDVTKIADIERHHDTGNVGLGLVSGFKLQRGAFASSIGHDSHNLIVTGTNSQDMLTAIEAISATDGGLAVVDGQTVTVLPLPVGGLMSDQSATQTATQLRRLQKAFHAIAPDVTFDPFITLSFLSLPVIPSLKITDQGLYDFDAGRFIDVADTVVEKH